MLGKMMSTYRLVGIIARHAALDLDIQQKEGVPEVKRSHSRE